MTAAHQLGRKVGRAAACRALNVPRASLYRHLRRSEPATPPAPRPSPPRALAPAERQQVLAQLHSERFRDRALVEVFATLLDEGAYLCSVRTMYRILEQAQEVRERRDQLRHPSYAAPQLLATRPNQLWSWDITKLLGPAKWTYFYLYVILDVFSRYVVGWMVAHRESATLAEKLIRATCARQGIAPGELTLHADRGSSMTSKPVAFLLADLGVTKTHSRPQCLRRQSVLGKPVQDPQVPARVPGPLRFHPGRPRLLPGLLFLVQPRPPPQRHRPAHPRDASLRPGRPDHRPTSGRPQPGLPTKSRTLRPGPSQATRPAHICLDQSAARAGGERRGATLIYAGTCLKVVDKFRRGSGCPDISDLPGQV
jgi:transposase InsO family protein